MKVPINRHHKTLEQWCNTSAHAFSKIRKTRNAKNKTLKSLEGYGKLHLVFIDVFGIQVTNYIIFIMVKIFGRFLTVLVTGN